MWIAGLMPSKHGKPQAQRRGGGNFDSADCLEQDRIKDELEDLIKATPISTDAGFAAFCKYVETENYIGDESGEFPDMHRWQWLKVMEWAQARAGVAA
jgi:hypothetical protein